MATMTLNHISDGVTHSATRCVACGEFMELSERGVPDHHCSDEFEAAVEELNRLAADDEFLDDIPLHDQLENLGYLSD